MDSRIRESGRMDHRQHISLRLVSIPLWLPFILSALPDLNLQFLTC